MPFADRVEGYSKDSLKSKPLDIMFETQSKLLEAIIGCIPYPSQIKDYDLSDDQQVRFTWRGQRFVVSLSGHTNEIEGGCQVGSNICIVMEAYFKSYFASRP